MTNTRDPVYDYGYYNDQANEYVVSLTTSVAAAGGFVGATSTNNGPLPKFCKMRHIGVVEPTSKQRHQIPMAVSGDAKFNESGTVDFGGETCQIVGKNGEYWRF